MLANSMIDGSSILTSSWTPTSTASSTLHAYGAAEQAAATLARSAPTSAPFKALA